MTTNMFGTTGTSFPNSREVRETEALLGYLECCRVWPVMLFTKVNRCGHCGNVPEWKG